MNKSEAERKQLLMQIQAIVERASAESHHDLTWQEKWDAYQALVKRRPALRDTWESFYAGASLDDDPVEAMERSIGLDPPKRELGDGEPSSAPCPECGGTGVFNVLQTFFAKCSRCSGAAQEVSPPSPDFQTLRDWAVQQLAMIHWQGQEHAVKDIVMRLINKAEVLGDTRELKAALSKIPIYKMLDNVQLVMSRLETYNDGHVGWPFASSYTYLAGIAEQLENVRRLLGEPTKE